MPIQTTWVQEPYIRLSIYEGVVTTTDIEEMLDRELNVYDNLQNKIYVVLDSQQMTKLAANPLKMPRLIKLLKHPNVAYMIMAGGDSIAKFWAQTVSKVFGAAPMRPAPSVDDAIELAQDLLRSQAI